MANVQLLDHPKGVVPRVASSYARRRFGRDVEPVAAAAHHSGVLVAAGLIETVAGKGWHKLDRHLMMLAVQASAGAIGCSWCVDFGYYEGLQRGVDPAKVRDVPVWRTSDVYDEREPRRAGVCGGSLGDPGRGERRTGRAAACLVQRCRDRRAGGLGRPRELPLSLQRRPRASQPGVFGQLPGPGGAVTEEGWRSVAMHVTTGGAAPGEGLDSSKKYVAAAPAASPCWSRPGVATEVWSCAETTPCRDTDRPQRSG